MQPVKAACGNGIRHVGCRQRFAEPSIPCDGLRSAGAASIALGPGYVISYTVGRFQLEELLAEYLHRLGDRAPLLDFHDRLMCYGTTPFTVVTPELLADLATPLATLRARVCY
jgi:hypothetical protein